MNQYIKAVLLAFVVTTFIGVVGCSGKGLNSARNLMAPTAERHDSATWLNFDPLAPAKRVEPKSAEEISGYPGVEKDGYRIVGVDGEMGPRPLPAGLDIKVKDTEVAVNLEEPITGDLYLYLFYSDQELHFAGSSPGAALADEYVFLAVPAEPGAVAIGIARIRTNGEPELPRGELARLRFGQGAESSARGVSDAPISGAKVENLAVGVNLDASVTLSWTELHAGDYNNDGIANISDVTPIAMYFGEEVEGAENPGLIDLVDGNRNGSVEIGDVTPLAINFGTVISGYNVYRTKLADAEENPDVEDTERWTYIERLGAEPPEQMPSVLRDYTGQDFRLPYTFRDVPTEPGYYAYYVRPFSVEGDDPSEGPKSNMAKTSQSTAMATLTLEVLNGPFFVVGGDVRVRVWLADAFGLFSVNARFEYNNEVLEFVSAAPSMDGYDPNVFYDAAYGGDPLFLGARVGPSESEPDVYDLAALNITKRWPAPTVQGSGPVMYFTFQVVGGSGVYPTAFRFPQGTTNIWVWGEEYNMPLPGPQLGEAQSINIVEG